MKRVGVVGGGPVGLYLACLLARAGCSVSVLEARVGRSLGSRSIGIHPPALEALALIGVHEHLIAFGVRMETALVYLEGRHLGSLSLSAGPPPFPFVLSLPQGLTETVLEERLAKLSPGALVTGEAVTGVRTRLDGVELVVGAGRRLEFDFVVGCDGRSSVVRESIGVGVTGGWEGYNYLMADLPESTGLGSRTALFLGRRGVVESFPLPGDRRRWVAGSGATRLEPRFAELAALVQGRTGLELPVDSASVTSSFGAETRLARCIAGKRWALAGDAAHVISPIGGQGMNLGLLGARALAHALTEEKWRPRQYHRRQSVRARRAASRARFNMTLGSPGMPPAVRAVLLRALLARPLGPLSVRYFTMRGL